MGRWLLFLVSVTTILCCSDCSAGWYGRWYGYGGYGGWGNYGWGGSTPYSNAVRAQADLTMARGAAAENYAKASIANEQARSVYLDNEAKFLEMRRQQKAAYEAKKQQRLDEAKARNALRPPPKPASELYPRLSTDQLDPLTGEIHWPDSLSGSEYAEDRKVIEDALKSQAELGPNERTSRIIYDAAHNMMAIRARNVSELGSQGYAACRKFLNSLAIEGEHAQEASK
jgi:hypothetical protein